MKPRAFALRDCVVAIAMLAVLAMLALPVLSQVRIDSARQRCNDNYRFIAEASDSYANSHAGQMWALNWKRGMLNPGVFYAYYFASDTEAQSWQAVLILRRLAHLNENQSPVPAGWLPEIVYSHVALLDYVNLPIPASYMVCPEDWTRAAYVEGDFRNLPPGGESGVSNWRWPYSSSYTAGVYQWSPSRQYTQLVNGSPAKAPMFYSTTSAGFTSWTYDGTISVPDALRPRLASDVRYPANKVFMSDDYARHNGKPRYYAYQSAGQDLLFYDGSVRYFRSDHTNPGWNPTSSSGRGNMKSRFFFTKLADFWGGLDNNATQANFVAGWYRWTRGGLNGWDVPRLKSMIGKLPNANTIENEVDTSATTGAW